MAKEALVALQRECSSTLQTYIDQARKTCSMLRMSKGEPLTADNLRKIMHQRSLENEAHERYMEVRERLFEVAQRGYGKAGSTQG
jgi:PP-loop superfamily ATP-utilizing enzyme